MNWFNDMLLLFLEWLLIMIIPLVIGVLIGWLIWGRKSKACAEENDRLRGELDACITGVLADGEVASKTATIEAPTAEVEAETVEEKLVVETPEVKDDLTLIDGIEADEIDSLNGQGIYTFKQLALTDDSNVEVLEAKINYTPGQIRKENWIPQAAQMHFEKYGQAIYDQVNVSGVYADAFEAQMAEAKKGVVLDYHDDLKEISGVGPKMEKILQDFGITTFYQLSLLKEDGVAALNDKIQTFPGRIERDNWIGQAGDLHKKHHE